MQSVTGSPPESLDHYCVVGHPVAHSKSPWIHARFAELTGQRLLYDRKEAPLHGFAQALAALRAAGGKGCNVTVPFKFEAAALATTCTARAQLAGAANTLVFSDEGIAADNTDGVGLTRDIQQHAGFDLRGRHVLLLGAGGAAAGVLGALIDAGCAEVVVVNRTLVRAQALVKRHAEIAALQKMQLHACPLIELAGKFDVVINATASSLQGDSLDLPAHLLAPQALAYDLMYGAAAQPFMAWAREHGGQARDGLGMLVEQAAEAFFIWRGVRPPSAQVLAELRQANA
ncbi:MAG: shikimate dehydrogenase [Burkholderiales bacterium]